jgi:hypothetical protein
VIDRDRLLSFLKAEAEERMAFMRPEDPSSKANRDIGFIEGMEVVAAYVEWVSNRPTLADVERGAA